MKQDELEKLVREIHKSVLVIENDHGQKLEALFDGLDAVNNRLDSMDNRLDSMDHRLERVETDVCEIKGNLGLLKTIASDYDTRISRLEKMLSAHLETHP